MFDIECVKVPMQLPLSGVNGLEGIGATWILKILNLIREDGHAKVQELSRIFNVTDVTIRQDLEELEKQGFVLREHGGTFLKDAGPFAKAGKVFNQTPVWRRKG